MFNDTMQGKAEHLGIYMGGTPQFVEDERRGCSVMMRRAPDRRTLRRQFAENVHVAHPEAGHAVV